jgi:hypothetical protein
MVDEDFVQFILEDAVTNQSLEIAAISKLFEEEIDMLILQNADATNVVFGAMYAVGRIFSDSPKLMRDEFLTASVRIMIHGANKNGDFFDNKLNKKKTKKKKK